MRLRWCGVPDSLGFRPIHLANDQHEFLNVFRIEEGAPTINFGTFPPEVYAPGHPTFLAPNVGHRVKLSIIADNAQPVEIWLTVAYTGDFSALPDSLEVSATA